MGTGTRTRAHRIRRRPPSLRRPLLAAGALLSLASPAISSGCVASFEPISEVQGLRVLAAPADKPYAAAGDDVTFTLDYYDGYVDPADPDGAARNVQIVWLGGCFDPPDDAYFGCYPQLAELFQSLGSTDPLSTGLIGFGPSFTLKLPDDIISRRPKPMVGPHYGIAYVFFAACAGQIKPIPPESAGKAGSFPLGCFDPEGNRLGADSFVPGYTQIYAFEDGRTNTNPVVTGFKIDGETVEEGIDHEAKVESCPITDAQRDLPPSCTREDPFAACKSYELDIDVPKDVAEVDLESKTLDGKMLHEAVWVDYFAEKGSFDGSVALVSDAVTGVTDDHKVKWLPPPEAGRVTLWAVVRDARGGSTFLTRYVQVE
jgi:hypothetical protein